MLQGIKPEPIQTLEWNGRTIRLQPPIIGDVCITPRSGRAKWLCGYKASTCKGETKNCERCRYNYCNKHFASHVRRIISPPDTWVAIDRNLRTMLDRAAEKPECRIRSLNLEEMEKTECLP